MKCMDLILGKHFSVSTANGRLSVKDIMKVWKGNEKGGKVWNDGSSCVKTVGNRLNVFVHA